MQHTDTDSSSTGPYTKRVLQLVDVMKSLVTKGKTTHDVSLDDWSALKEIIAHDKFIRVGPFHDQVDWQGYIELLTQWVNHSEGWEPAVRRLTEVSGLVHMQCEERLTHGGEVHPFQSLSVYEFDESDKIVRIDVYMQMSMEELQASLGQQSD